ncbi:MULTISPECIES: CaiB/BaiF CoA-transferase family protein [Rhodobacterales]|uniref:CaiB/BaiF CoA transferase family protein n=1 Tax=Roseobacter sp. N2S TaxID=2663844 RepID=UPI00285C3D8E|nr:MULTISPECIES: CaiB/BaiF CoA-transferase family protein [Rhodobacterales]MDR6265764.1 crotonobetainyl-CoA:carnitine CoA-transferase CaiB-like acyl-CoA transferase [Roseobacter sp. N2S]
MTDTFAPLAGIRVVEMSHMIMGPSCGMFLGYLGAEVIKVEPPQGDKTRSLTGMGRPMFPLFNRGKKSVTIDVKTDAGRAALDKLLSTADVFVENFRDASLVKAGVDAQTLRAKYPKLVFAACKGFLSGPYQNRTALDEVVQMMTGLAYMTGPTGTPLRVGSSANDIMGGLFAAFSVIASLMERKETGKGREVRVGLFENCLLLVAQHMVQFELEGKNPPPMPEREFSWPVYDIFKDKNGKQIFVGAVTEGQWAAICKLLELDDLLTHPQLQNRMDQINARDWTIPLVAAKIAARTEEDLAPEFEAAGLPFSPIAKPSDMYDNPHVMRKGGMSTSAYEDTTFRAPALPFEVDGVMLTGGGDVPEIGRDNAEILAALDIDAATLARVTGQSGQAA